MKVSRFAFVLFLVVFPLGAAASEPGQPLDCSDWVFLEPGLSCEPYVAYPCPEGDPRCRLAPAEQLDNQGRRFRIETRLLFELPKCPATNGFLTRYSVVAFTESTESVIGYVDERCNVSENYVDAIDNVEQYFLFEEESGRLIIDRVRSRCSEIFGCTAYESVEWLPVISGFPTTFEILQSYNPAFAELSFRVPYMPEGLPTADYFDTYYGSLASVGDWSQAQPLACGYPPLQPVVGDYITVADTTPTPGPGQGYWFVTAVSHAGELRYGRKASDGVLSGRNPGVLPVCD